MAATQDYTTRRAALELLLPFSQPTPGLRKSDESPADDVITLRQASR